MRYAQGGGLTAEGRRRREQVRLKAVEMFEQRAPAAEIAAELRVTERSVRPWRRARLAGGPSGRPPADRRHSAGWMRGQLAELEAGPLAAGYSDQRWTLARIRDLVARRFKVSYTIPGTWYPLRRPGRACQLGARRAIERDDGADFLISCRSGRVPGS